MTTSDVHLVPRTLLGPGSIAGIPELLRSRGIKKPFLISDEFLKSTGLVDRIADSLSAAGIDHVQYNESRPDPTTDSLNAPLQLIAEYGADSLVAIGGGSPMDTAKALAVLAANGGEMSEYKAPRFYTGPALPLVAVPTTAGTGSEVTKYTVIIDSRTGEKMLCTGPSFLPWAAVIDYELTLSMPARLTADTAVDALTHAIEAYVSRRANPISDVFAESAMKSIGGSITKVWRDPSDRDQREAMMLGATLAGIAFSNASVCLVHGMSRPLGAAFGIAHGLSNAMLLPEVTAFSLLGAVDRYAEAARFIGVPGLSDDPTTDAYLLLEYLRRLNKELEVPTVKSLGIDPIAWQNSVSTMASQALASGSPNNNPIVATQDEIEQLYLTVGNA